MLLQMALVHSFSCLSNILLLLSLWNSLGKNTGVGSHFLLQRIFLTQGLNLGGVFLVASDGKESAYNVGGWGSIPESGRSPGEGNGNSLQYYYLDNSMDRGAWWGTVHEVTQSWT